ncbi:MAG: alternative ribosome rescue aminoacyl-tRNA hydrolase ArfB [Nocardioidaceae bacterium]
MRTVRVRGIDIPEAELRWRFSRSSGPGGQSVNTADSRVELSFDLGSSMALPARLHERALARLADRLVRGVLTVSAAEHRSQLRNREAARHRLELLLVDATAPPRSPRRPTHPTAGSRRRRLEQKRTRGAVKRLRRQPPADG